MAGPEHDFAARVLHAPRERVRLFTALVLRYVDWTAPLRVLDLGCGTGEQLFDLAQALPNASLSGVDISSASIRMAEETCARHGLGGRIGFEAADYMEFRGQPFDLVVSWGVLHLIPASTEALFAKVASDLTRGGLLVAAMPYRCLHNSVLGLARRGLRAARSPLVDALILALVRRLHGRRFSEAFLRERVHYMYCPAARLESRWLRGWLDQVCDLEVVGQHPEPRISWFQYRYRTTALRRR